MTRESRLLFSLDEIVGLRWQCTKCASAILYQLDQSIELPQKCPSCGGIIVSDGSSLDDLQHVQQFVSALKATLRSEKAKRLGAVLKLEMLDGPR
jgi:PHP family Zn ribbon phosphoesterase